ncbi:MAG: glutamyl-tRNA reductase [Sarcina sp.]
MIQLVGIKENTPLKIREKLALKGSEQRLYLNKFKEFARGVVILSTCNRTEIYFNSSKSSEEVLRKVFEQLNWDISLKEYILYKEGEEAIGHLMEVVCGFKSRIVGEDQILGQIKNAYGIAKEEETICGILQRLFESSISCGKKFRTECKMYEIPVSAASIVTNMAFDEEKRKFMVMGYGEIGRAVCTNILANKDCKILYVVVRNKEVLLDIIEDERVIALNFGEKDEYIKEVDCIIGATSAPHTIVRRENIIKPTLIFDLALPRDIEENVKEVEGVKLYDIDEISLLDSENKRLRVERMMENRFLLEETIEEYIKWEQLRDISSLIKEMKIKGNEVWMERLESFKNKSHCQEDELLAEKLLKSIVNSYTNRAIELLKEETLKGSEEECLKLIKKVFLEI